jgi:hypothetical protein
MNDFVLIDYAGAEFWKVMFETPGPLIGDRGRIFRYCVYTEKGLRLGRTLAVRRIEQTLADKRGWTRGAVRFQRVAEGADTDVLIASPAMVDKLCYPLKTEGEVSCCQGRKVVINYLRWRDAVEHWPYSGTSYRQMLINHEFGHRIGKGHERFSGPGQKAPVMQQQTYGLQGCKANAWPLDHELLRG